MDDREAHSLFSIYSYNPHDPDFDGHGYFETYLFDIHNASPICVHCHTIADTAMHTILFCPSWATERTSLFERLGLDVFDIWLHCQDGYMLCCVLDSLRGFLQSCYAQERAGRVGASGPEDTKNFLAQAYLGSDDNHV